MDRSGEMNPLAAPVPEPRSRFLRGTIPEDRLTRHDKEIGKGYNVSSWGHTKVQVAILLHPGIKRPRPNTKRLDYMHESNTPAPEIYKALMSPMSCARQILESILSAPSSPANNAHRTHGNPGRERSPSPLLPQHRHLFFGGLS